MVGASVDAIDSRPRRMAWCGDNHVHIHSQEVADQVAEAASFSRNNYRSTFQWVLKKTMATPLPRGLRAHTKSRQGCMACKSRKVKVKLNE